MPTADIKAMMSLTGAGMLDLERDVALNGIPERYHAVKRILTLLRLADHKGAVSLLASLESEAVAVAMNNGDLGTRIVALSDLSDSPRTTIPEGYSLVLVKEAGVSPDCPAGAPLPSDGSDVADCMTDMSAILPPPAGGQNEEGGNSARLRGVERTTTFTGVP